MSSNALLDIAERLRKAQDHHNLASVSGAGWRELTDEVTVILDLSTMELYAMVKSERRLRMLNRGLWVAVALLAVGNLARWL